MSLNTKLSKEAQFAYHVFSVAAQGSIRDSKYATHNNLIMAGGAIRDLYFDRSNTRDLDLYFDGTTVGADQFAYHLKTMDIDRMAREHGFEGAVLIRRGSADGQNLMQAGDGFLSIGLTTTPSAWFAPSGAATANAVAAISTGYPVAGVQASHSNSGSGSKQDPAGRVHPLRSVEEFTLKIDGYKLYDIELMNVAMDPIEYVMEHFAIKLSRCYYDGKAVRYTNDFFTDAKNKTLTVACPIEHARFERLFSYYLPKMKHYFPDFSVRVDLDAMNSGSSF